MSRELVKLTGLETNGIGTNTQKIPSKLDVLGLTIELLSGTCLIGDFGLITLYGNTQPLHQYLTGAELDDIDRYDNVDAYATGGRNILHLPLERLGLKEINQFYGTTLRINQPADGNNSGSGNPVAADAPAGVPVFTSASLEFVIAATAVAPSFQVWAEVERNSDFAQGAGAVMRRKRYTDVIAGTAEEGFSFIKFGNKQLRFIRRIFLSNSGGTINRVRLTRDGKEVFNRTAAVNTSIQRRYGKTGPVGVWDYIVDFTENGVGEDLDTLGAGDLELLITASAGGNLVAYVEYGGAAY